MSQRLLHNVEKDKRKMREMEISQILNSLGLSENAARILVYLHRIYPKNNKWAEIKDLEKVVKIGTVSLKKDFVKERLLFCWENIPGTDNEKLIKFLRKEFRIDWVMKARIEKADDNITIKVYYDKNYILLSLNKGNSKVKLELDGSEQDELIVKSRYDELKIYKSGYGNERRVRKKQKPLNIALEELKERNWINEEIISPNEQRKNKSGVLIFANKRYKLKENFSYIIDDLEKQHREVFDEATAKIQHLRYCKDDADSIETFISLGICKNNAKILTYLMKVKEASSNKIKEDIDLKLPEISIAVKILKESDWINEREEKHGTGRPTKIYSLKVDLEQIIAELKKQPQKAFDVAQKNIARLRDLTK